MADTGRTAGEDRLPHPRGSFLSHGCVICITNPRDQSVPPDTPRFAWRGGRGRPPAPNTNRVVPDALVRGCVRQRAMKTTGFCEMPAAGSHASDPCTNL